MLKATRMERSYAIKVILNERDEAAEQHLQKFRLECEILKRIKHPQIPEYVDTFSLYDAHYLVQEYVEGMPLSHFIATGRRFEEAEVKELTRQLLTILTVLHSPQNPHNAVIHRDLRLSNLMLSSGTLYLIDFGLARFSDPKQFAFIADPVEDNYYSNPNHPSTYHLLRREVSPRSDLFGTGVVAVDLFTTWVEDESLFKKSWEEVLPLSEQFKVFIKKLLCPEGFVTSMEALAYLQSL